MARQVAVAATSPAAVDAGLFAVHEGGNAVDAAISAMLVAMSTEPGIVSLLGGAFVMVWPEGGEPVVIDGNVEMPGRDLPEERFGAGMREITTAYGGGVTLYAGHGSVATPGSLAALGAAHRAYGAGDWAAILVPAERACRHGYPVGAAAASYLAITADSVFGWDPYTHPLVKRPDGRPLQAGDVVVNPELAEALELIGREGASCAYTGEIGRTLARDMGERGGLITQADLTAYRAVTRTPLFLNVANWRLATNPPPSIGGPMLALMLREAVQRGEATPADLIEIQRHVLSYRAGVHDYSQDLENDGWDILEVAQRHGLAGLPTSSSTAHVSAVDSEGNACAITASSGYGSGATVPGTGLMLNNCLGEPELNRLGLHVLAPGTRLASNMTPTVGRSPEGEVLAIGTPGADRITTALMQVLWRYCLRGESLQRAIDAPRLHVRVVDGGARVEHEDGSEIEAAAVAAGLEAVSHGPHAMFFGGVGAARRMPDGRLGAAGDGRRAAATGVG
jgi:gamma-glutamyltranspeptidase/glutathione hydrolase